MQNADLIYHFIQFCSDATLNMCVGFVKQSKFLSLSPSFFFIQMQQINLWQTIQID